jgi:hypothetical protein
MRKQEAMIPKKSLPPDLIRGVQRFSENIMLKQGAARPRREEPEW